MSYTSYVLMIVAFNPPPISGVETRVQFHGIPSGWIQCHETIEHRNGEMRLHLRER